MTEIAPGVDLERDILERRPSSRSLCATGPGTMDAALFRAGAVRLVLGGGHA